MAAATEAVAQACAALQTLKGLRDSGAVERLRQALASRERKPRRPERGLHIGR